MTKDKKESDSLEKAHRDLISNRPSSLVKRALDDLARLKAHPLSGPEQSHSIDLQKKRQIRVAIGNFDKNMNDVFSELIKEAIKDKYALTIKPVFYGEELTEIAANDEADILIVIVHNIYFRSSYPKEHIEKSLQLITQIKKTYEKLVIALYIPALKLEGGILLELGKSVKQAGADFYFPLPFNFDDFKIAFEKCMNEVLRRAS